MFIRHPDAHQDLLRLGVVCRRYRSKSGMTKLRDTEAVMLNLIQYRYDDEVVLAVILMHIRIF
ncbi:hypothetical protein CBP12_00410 [Oceanisphaera avium]|uniref:Uncharacterized protein n=1 Tax=Oceanisphaera avium TaxID=1903694 RepID=A0A1Y0CTX8_9GAMM|nr:hypothetical protein CBP12_00410 [Oceanisphaera avium]